MTLRNLLAASAAAFVGVSVFGQASVAAENPVYAFWKAATPGTSVIYASTMAIEAPKKSEPGGVVAARVVDGFKFINPNTFGAAFEKLRKEKGMAMTEKELEAEFKKKRSTSPQANQLANETRVTVKSVSETEVVLSVTDLTALDHPENMNPDGITREFQFPSNADGTPADLLNDWLVNWLAGPGGWKIDKTADTAESCPLPEATPRCTAREFRLAGTGDNAKATRTLKAWFAPEVVGGVAKRTIKQTVAEGKATVKLEITQTVKEVTLPKGSVAQKP